MKKIIIFIMALALSFALFGCAANKEYKTVPESFADAESVMDYLLEQNEIYVKKGANY